LKYFEIVGREIPTNAANSSIFLIIDLLFTVYCIALKAEIALTKLLPSTNIILTRVKFCASKVYI
jgi:hypothetical protein